MELPLRIPKPLYVSPFLLSVRISLPFIVILYSLASAGGFLLNVLIIAGIFVVASCLLDGFSLLFPLSFWLVHEVQFNISERLIKTAPAFLKFNLPNIFASLKK